MSLSHSFEQATLTDELEISSLLSLLESGLHYIQQERFAEGTAVFALARAQLSPNQLHIAAALDKLAKSFTNYMNAQQALHEVSKRYAESVISYQAQIAALEQLLPTLGEDGDQIPPTIAQPPTNFNGCQLPQLLRPSLTNSRSYQSAPEPKLPPEADESLPPLYFTCFGRFEVRRFGPLGQPIVLCSNRNGQTVLRHLVAQSKHRETIDVLMAALWPEDAAEVAQHKLRVAISALRRSLNSNYVSEPGRGYILCLNQAYELNSSVTLGSDVDEFLKLYQVGRQASGSAAAVHYEKACQLYTGPFLTEDLYADWSFTQREQLSKTYLVMCSKLAEYYLEIGHYEDAAKWAATILKENRCDEGAHRLLIRAYAVQGHRSEALQQYQRCQRVLYEELDVQPMPETVSLLYTLLNNTNSPTMK